MSRGPDAATLIERALARKAADAGCDPVLIAADWERWASATFTGARHRVELSLADSQESMDWLNALPEADFTLRGHLVADLAVGHLSKRLDRRIATIDILTVEDR